MSDAADRDELIELRRDAGALGFFLRLLKLLKREHLLANQQLSNPAHSGVSPKKTTGFQRYRVATGYVKQPPLAG